ncbi:MAG TPA: hypothetical protein VHT51_03915 [Micropepsaceae bacterium]|jgi:hypothetical protein|nr:hypothetical protein [Micropepsaceae bacterium]
MQRLIRSERLVLLAKRFEPYRHAGFQELQHFRKLPSCRDVIREASLCLTKNGKRHSHQRRIPRQVLINAERALQKRRTDLRKAPSFFELHKHVKVTIGGIHGIGPLTIYDIAQRIGAYLKLEPEHIYLHAGTREGARALGLLGEMIEVGELPKELRYLSPKELEDFLCIFKAELAQTPSRLGVRASSACYPDKRKRNIC